ncbi:hypothetical protein [Spartinivicinus marinus]|nr:hypothetical protein [Spartinivicinus marinus]MCX4027869.1 hypothetical protein [Spartinivicinus marinus]
MKSKKRTTNLIAMAKRFERLAEQLEDSLEHGSREIALAVRKTAEGLKRGKCGMCGE